MTDERIDELKRLSAAVEAEPFYGAGRNWRAVNYDGRNDYWSVYHYDPKYPDDLSDEFDLLEDRSEAACALMAAAKQAIPELIAEVERLRAAVAPAPEVSAKVAAENASILYLTRMDWSASDIAMHTGMTIDQVNRRIDDAMRGLSGGSAKPGPGQD